MNEYSLAKVQLHNFIVDLQQIFKRRSAYAEEKR